MRPAIGVVWAYFVLKETKGVPLEELGRIATELHGGRKTTVEEVEGTRAEHFSEKNTSTATESVWFEA